MSQHILANKIADVLVAGCGVRNQQFKYTPVDPVYDPAAHDAQVEAPARGVLLGHTLWQDDLHNPCVDLPRPAHKAPNLLDRLDVLVGPSRGRPSNALTGRQLSAV